MSLEESKFSIKEEIIDIKPDLEVKIGEGQFGSVSNEDIKQEQFNINNDVEDHYCDTKPQLRPRYDQVVVENEEKAPPLSDEKRKYLRKLHKASRTEMYNAKENRLQLVYRCAYCKVYPYTSPSLKDFHDHSHSHYEYLNVLKHGLDDKQFNKKYNVYKCDFDRCPYLAVSVEHLEQHYERVHKSDFDRVPYLVVSVEHLEQYHERVHRKMRKKYNCTECPHSSGFYRSFIIHKSLCPNKKLKY